MPSIRDLVDDTQIDALRNAPGPVEKRQVHGSIEFKATKEDDGKLFFEGFANTVNPDRMKEVVLPKAFRRSLKGFLKNNPQVFYNHNWNVSVGGITEAQITEKGLWVRGYVQPATDENGEMLFGEWGDFLRMIRGQVKRGQIRTLSIGFRIIETRKAKMKDPNTLKEIDGIEITNLELMEISLVTVPANRESVIEVQKAMATLYGEDIANQMVGIESEYLSDEMGEEPDSMSKRLQTIVDAYMADGFTEKQARDLLAQVHVTKNEGGTVTKVEIKPNDGTPTSDQTGGHDQFEVVSMSEVREKPRLIQVSIRKDRT